MSHLKRQALNGILIAMAAVPAVALCAAGDNGTCSNPTGSSDPRGKTLESVADHPAAREGWFLAARKQAAGGRAAAGSAVPPARRLLQSYRQIGQMPHPGGLASAASWAPLGPAPQRSLYWGNVSGRVTALAIDTRGGKRALYIGAAFGGLWLTLDFGATKPHFSPLGDAIWPSLAVGSIALDLSPPAGQPPVIYVGTGEANSALDSYYGIGILKSTDGGVSWFLSTGRRLDLVAPSTQYDLDGPLVGTAVGKIVIDPADPHHLFAAVTSSGLTAGKTTAPAIYQSINAGQSWSPMPLAGFPAGTAYNATDLIAEPVEHAFYAAVQGAGIYRLATGETAWTATASPFASAAADGYTFYRASLATRVVAGQPVIYAIISSGNSSDFEHSYTLSTPSAEDTGIVQSFDEGEHWMPVPAPPTLFREEDSPGQGFYDQWIAAPASSAGLLVAGIDIWSSLSATSPTWINATRAYDWAGGLAHPERHVHPDQHAVAVLSDADWIVGSDGGVWRTRDRGASWQNLNTDIDSIQFMSVTPFRSGGYLGGSQDNGMTIRKRVFEHSICSSDTFPTASSRSHRETRSTASFTPNTGSASRTSPIRIGCCSPVFSNATTCRSRRSSSRALF
jgi:hypothetical protein